jgi:tetratricopeptide (TPR) repeat protein
MTVGGRSRSLVLAASIAIFLCIPHSALAGWQEDYTTGKEAYEEGKLDRADRYLRAALAKKDKEKANAIKKSGMFFEPYLPHFYLGMTLFQKKDYPGALEEFSTSRSMGVIEKHDDLYDRLKETRKIAKAAAEAAASQKTPEPQPAAPEVAVTPPPRPTPDSGTGSGGTAASAEATGKTGGGDEGATPSRDRRSGVTKAEPLTPAPKPATPSGPDPALTRAIDAAAGDVAAAQKFVVDAGDLLNDDERSRLTRATSGIREAATVAEASAGRQALKTLQSELQSQVDGRRRDRAARAEAAEAESRRLAEIATARRESASVLSDGESFLNTHRDDLKPSERGRLSREISTLQSADSADGLRRAALDLKNDVEGLRKAIRQRAAAPEPASGAGKEAALAAARDRYAAGVQAYYQGDYDQALPVLEQAGDTLEDDPEVHALLGSALYKKYILTRAEDASLKARAEEAFRTALSIKNDYTLDTRYFPPKVVAFFKQVTAGR